MSNTKELLSLADPIFKEIEDAATLADIRRIEELFNYPPPSEWVSEYDSEIYPAKKYYGIDIEILEALASRVFTHYWFKFLDNKIIQDKSGVASSSILKFTGMFEPNGEKWTTIGSSCEPCANISQLKLAVPKSISSARGSAIRDLGTFFGKQLNRETDNLPVLQIAPPKSEVDEEFEKIKAKIIGMGKDDSEKFLPVSGFQYNHELKEIINQKTK